MNINTLIYETVESFLPLAQRKGLALVYLPREPFPWVACDKDRITQVLVNLLQNAIKFSQKGTVAVGVEVSENAVRVYVSDEGIGIRKEDEAKLFHSFSQLAEAASRGAGGTGLGLAISKSIVEGHGGSIGVESVYGQGSKFYFDLPIEKAESK